MIESIIESFLSEPEVWAIFFDIDGTLIDIAPTPDSVFVVPGLADNLSVISGRLNGALALITGRSIKQADYLFSPYRFPTAGLHGGERRTSDGNVMSAPNALALAVVKDRLSADIIQFPGLILEDKGAAIGLHYRLAPHFEAEAKALIAAAAVCVGPLFTIQVGKMVVELKPGGNKGSAVAAFLSEGNFRGRLPLVLGDDGTDEAMFDVANRLGGYSIKIGEATQKTLAQGWFDSPDSVRALIAAAAAQ